MENYITLSLETHLFFSRIMKEHALFLEAGFPCKDKAWINKAEWFKQEFEILLCNVVDISNGRISCEILNSNELVTEFTIPAEKRTECLSGVAIDSGISVKEKNLRAGCPIDNKGETKKIIDHLNRQSIFLLNGLIDFKEDILREVGRCKLFTANYPLLIKHILREAKLYRSIINDLMQNRNFSYKHLRETEEFWNQIMMEHALFIRGLLDPTEEELIHTADKFAMDYKKLLNMALANQQECMGMNDLSMESLEETLKYRKFKEAGAEGILNCNIASIILPLLADHVLREANHYIRILTMDC